MNNTVTQKKNDKKLLLLFSVGDEWYGLDVIHVIEVLPLVKVKAIPHSPGYVAGLIEYRGMVVPLIDITVLMSGKSSRSFFSTRIIVTDFPAANGQHQILALLAEKATETLSCKDEDFVAAGISNDNAPYLGDVIKTDRGIVQYITVENLLTGDVQALLF